MVVRVSIIKLTLGDGVTMEVFDGSGPESEIKLEFSNVEVINRVVCNGLSICSDLGAKNLHEEIVRISQITRVEVNIVFFISPPNYVTTFVAIG